jgi:hypothetical protein
LPGAFATAASLWIIISNLNILIAGAQAAAQAGAPLLFAIINDNKRLPKIDTNSFMRYLK